jgi:hypothetical protein
MSFVVIGLAQTSGFIDVFALAQQFNELVGHLSPEIEVSSNGLQLDWPDLIPPQSCRLSGHFMSDVQTNVINCLRSAGNFLTSIR